MEQKTLQLHNFAAVQKDGNSVLGKVLYYSLSNILIGKDEVPSSNLGSSSSKSLVPQRLQGFSYFSDSHGFLGLASI